MEYWESEEFKSARTERHKEFYKCIALYLARVLETYGLDCYRLWSEGLHKFEEKHGTSEEFESKFKHMWEVVK